VRTSKRKPALIKLIKPYHDKDEVETATKLRMLSGEEMDLDESGNQTMIRQNFISATDRF